MTADPFDDIDRYLALSPQGREFVEFWLSLEGDALTRWEEIVFGIRRAYGRLDDEHIEWLPKFFRGAGLT